VKGKGAEMHPKELARELTSFVEIFIGIIADLWKFTFKPVKVDTLLIFPLRFPIDSHQHASQLWYHQHIEQ
jgi:hypothetical protein